jgi:hypothetical protein
VRVGDVSVGGREGVARGGVGDDEAAGGEDRCEGRDDGGCVHACIGEAMHLAGCVGEGLLGGDVHGDVLAAFDSIHRVSAQR